MATNQKQRSATTNSERKIPLETEKTFIAPKLDYGDLKTVWKGLIDSKRADAESHLLHITNRLSKVDPIAKGALLKVKEEFPADEAALRQLISRKGWATELLQVTKRINSLRISENKRLVLASVYPHILHKLLKCNITEEAVGDTVGFTGDVMFELERKDGPLDVFAQEIVRMTGVKNRIEFPEDNVLRDLVAHQIRSGL